MFSSKSENFKRYAHFHEQIYITALGLGVDKTMIRTSISSPFRVYHSIRRLEIKKCTQTVANEYSRTDKNTANENIVSTF